MHDHEKLCYDVAKNSSNVVDFEPNLLRHARMNFGSVADQILKTKVVPVEWTTPFVMPSLPEGKTSWNELEVAMMMSDQRERRDLIAKWRDYNLPRFVSFLELCLHPTAVTRINNVKFTEWKLAIETLDILSVHRIIVESHTFLQGGVGFKDDDEVRKEHSNFTYISCP